MFLSHVIACMSNADQLAIVERAKGDSTTSRPMAVGQLATKGERLFKSVMCVPHFCPSFDCGLQCRGNRRYPAASAQRGATTGDKEGDA